MARVNHKLVKQRLNEKRSKITDRQFFTSRLFAGHLEDLAAAQTRRYHYSIVGRWPAMFLVKTDCTEYSLGERGIYVHTDFSAPEGFMWVACARKKDIQWDEMRKWHNQKATERFHDLEEMFQAGVTDEKYCIVTEEGVLSCGEIVYRKGQTLEEYLKDYGIPEDWRYPISVHDIFCEEEYFSKSEYDVYNVETKTRTTKEGWRETLDDFIDDADDEDVFVGIDYHI